ncbi:hypothetical protein [Candidatus Leptofilum sp.]|uniref:hypothetical protein n=1 Tax=Candidatus Leptofilum sp. TaxID=3241576 RepID=UPI003B599EA8
MRLVFSVLWFDDDEEYFDSLDLEPLEREISSWGFWPKIEKVTTPEDFSNRSPFTSYDLIVVDRNLEGYKDGQEFIANIRGNAIYTEIIFYTAGNTSDLWEAIRTKELEGIFVSSRINVLSKIEAVGLQSVRKILDLENVRGIVMAEVGELDLLLDEIIMLGTESLSEEERSSIFQRFHENAVRQSEGYAKALNAFIEEPNTGGMLALCDSDKRWQNFNRLRKIHKKLKKKKQSGNYVQEVLRPRNFLAHGKPEPHENGGYLFRYKGKEYYFDDKVSQGLRQTILKYKTTFSILIDQIKET